MDFSVLAGRWFLVFGVGFVDWVSVCFVLIGVERGLIGGCWNALRCPITVTDGIYTNLFSMAFPSIFHELLQ